jgi:hypothetical protein
MEFNATIDLIIRDLEDARGIIDDLKKIPGVPVLQIELAKAKCKSAAEVISLLKQEEGSRSAAEIPLQREQKTEVEERSDEIPPQREQKPKTEVEKPEPVTASRIPHAAFPEPQSPEIKIDNSAKKPSEGTTIGDSFSHLTSRFNEQLGNRKTDDDLSGMMKLKPITSLTEAIGINDRFLYIREIFNGNKEAYSQAITKLENVTSIADARAIIMSYTGDSGENEAVKQLFDLVKRKLPADE